MKYRVLLEQDEDGVYKAMNKTGSEVATLYSGKQTLHTDA
jgi:hypothetical protein